MSDWLAGFIFISILAVVSYPIGHLLLNLAAYSDQKTDRAFFFRLFTGTIFIVASYAIIRSGGRTAQLLFMIPAIFLFFIRIKNKNALHSVLKFYPPTIQQLGVFVFFTAFISFWLSHFFESQIIQKDIAYYLKIAESLNLTGQENVRNFKNVFSNDFHGVEPYHYFETWLAALAMKISDPFTTNLVALRVISYGYILVLVCVGLMSLAEQIFRTQPRIYFAGIVLLLLFFIPNFLDLFINYGSHFSFQVESNALLRSNFRTYWLGLLPVVLLAAKKQHYRASIVALFLPVFSVTTVPAIFSTLFLLVVMNWKLKLVTRKEAWYILLGIFSMAIGYYLLGALFQVKSANIYQQLSIRGILDYYKAIWKAIVYVTAMTVFVFLILYLPVLLVLGFAAGKRRILFIFSEYKFLFVFTFILLVSGIGIYQAFTFMNNSYQMAYISCVALTLVVFMLFMIVYAELKTDQELRARFVLILGIGMLGFSAIFLFHPSRSSLFVSDNSEQPSMQPYSVNYLKQLDNYFETHSENRIGAYIADEKYYDGLYYSMRMPDVYFPLSTYYIFSQVDNSYLICLSDTADMLYGYHGQERDLVFLKGIIKAAMFRSAGSDSVQADQQRIEFIDKYHIHYLVLTPGVHVSAAIQNRVEAEYVDDKTGEHFLALKTK
jgi:hypothetical protein